LATAALLVMLPAAMGSMLLTSPDFEDFQDIPGSYGCTWPETAALVGPSPPLEWYRTPEKTRSLALVVDDVNSDGHVHWLVSNIPPETTALGRDASRYNMPLGATEFYNSNGDIGFGSFCPINETHVYRFRLYALRIPKFDFESPHRYMNAFPLTLDMVEKQLQAIESDIIYVANLAGKIYVQGYDPQTSPSPSPSPQVLRITPDIPMRRYVKPSEILKNARPHYGPRPLVETDKQELCKRYKAGNFNYEYSQLCVEQINGKVMGEKLRQFVDGGGVEMPEHLRPKNELLATKSVVTRAVSNKDGPQPTHKVDAPLMTEAERFASVVDWECLNGTTDGDNLQLGSPVVDSCTPQHFLPTEFSCNHHSLEDRRASPPLVWTLKDRSGCKVESYVLYLEEVKTGRINWLVKDIPTSVTYFDVGQSGQPGNDHGIEQLNSYKTDSYVAPCAQEGSAELYRFHLHARPTTISNFEQTGTTLAAGLQHQMSDSCAQAQLDVAAR